MATFEERFRVTDRRKNAEFASESPYHVLTEIEEHLGYFIDTALVIQRIEARTTSEFERALFTRSAFTPEEFQKRIRRSERLARILISHTVQAAKGRDVPTIRTTGFDNQAGVAFEEIISKIANHTSTRVADELGISVEEELRKIINPKEVLRSLSDQQGASSLWNQLYGEREWITEEPLAETQWIQDLHAIPLVLRSLPELYRETLVEHEYVFDGGTAVVSRTAIVALVILAILGIFALGLSGTEFVVIGLLISALHRYLNSIAPAIPDALPPIAQLPLVLRTRLSHDPTLRVAVFPEGTSTMELFQEYDVWGTLTSLFESNPDFMAVYERAPKQHIKHFAEVKRVTDPIPSSLFGRFKDFDTVQKQGLLLELDRKMQLAQPIEYDGTPIRSPAGKFVNFGVFTAATTVSDLFDREY